ncbi:MAG: DUF4157 domain-containing protein [Chitinophagaceae bacterium]|jgi:hypothetical protein|nr:DUF4157 domain-containing protein [Chitinophagaceae bacterium]
MKVRIKEKSLLARIAAYNLKSDKMAIVVGNTIRLHNTTKEEFLSNTKWVRHEVAHVRQYQEKGFIRFIASYLLETFNLGYEFNRYELDAIKKERDHRILEGVEFV